MKSLIIHGAACLLLFCGARAADDDSKGAVKLEKAEFLHTSAFNLSPLIDGKGDYSVAWRLAPA